MLELTKVPRGAPGEVLEQYLCDLMSALDDGLEAAEAVANGGTANADALHGYAQALEALHIGAAQKALSFGKVEPTEDDVRNARELVRLARDGAPSETLVEPARRAARVVTDCLDLGRFQSALYCLKDEALRVQHLGRIDEVLGMTLALFERGCRVAGFVSTPEDIANVRRLQQIAIVDGAEARDESLRLVQELEARLPPDPNLELLGREVVAKSLYARG